MPIPKYGDGSWIYAPWVKVKMKKSIDTGENILEQGTEQGVKDMGVDYFYVGGMGGPFTRISKEDADLVNENEERNK